MLSLREKTGVLVYRLHSLVHWRPRERELIEALNWVQQQAPGKYNRVVDIGCGHAPACATIRSQGLAYVGIDINAASIQYCKKKFDRAELTAFYCCSAKVLPVTLVKSDIVLLNGVLHHLTDSEAVQLYKNIGSCGALLVLDHEKQIESATIFSCTQQLIQRLDQGKFIRCYNYFTNLPGFDCAYRRKFMIRVLGFPLWPYFCHGYVPNFSNRE